MTLPSRPFNVAFFIEGMSASGVDTSTKLLATELRRLGHQATRFMPWDEDTTSGPIDAVRLPGMRVSKDQAVYWTYPLNLPLFEIFHKRHFDLIHVHTNTFINLLAWQISGAFHLPIVYTYHTMAKDYAHYLGPIHDHMGKLVDSAIEHYDKLICEQANVVVTPSVKAATYLRQIGVHGVEVIPNGINLNAFSQHSSDYLRRHFSIPASDKILLFAGRLNHEKRPLLVYECFRIVARTHEHVHLVMVGDGALREELQQRAEADGIADRLHLTGLVAYGQMPAIYNSADIWVSASCSEVHPMVAIEASACGLPAVAWQDAALDGVIEHQTNGFMVDCKEEFVLALHRLLTDTRLYQQMRQQTVKKVARFRVETTAQQMLDIYRTVIEENNRRPKPLHMRLPESFQKWQHSLQIRLPRF